MRIRGKGHTKIKKSADGCDALLPSLPFGDLHCVDVFGAGLAVVVTGGLDVLGSVESEVYVLEGDGVFGGVLGVVGVVSELGLEVDVVPDGLVALQSPDVLEGVDSTR